MLIVPITQREFELYALSLPRGPNFEPRRLLAAWKARNAISVGAVLRNERGQFETLVMRRQTDHRFIVTHTGRAVATADRATQEAAEEMRPDAPPEPLRPGMKKRVALVSKDIDGVSDSFRLLVTTIQHYPALMAISETYLAMPRPDDNFVQDFRTRNFDSRLWELYLLAAFASKGCS